MTAISGALKGILWDMEAATGKLSLGSGYWRGGHLSVALVSETIL